MMLIQLRFSLEIQQSYFKNIFNDPLFIMVAGLQVFHIEFEQIQGSGTCRTDRIYQKM